ncbi:MAG: hypothetical protein LBU62_01655 [Bacteroidales bacterium]|jgi:hypothetical protein|nr:hypothetical protein [Bacteroidales bacterium]
MNPKPRTPFVPQGQPFINRMLQHTVMRTTTAKSRRDDTKRQQSAVPAGLRRRGHSLSCPVLSVD